MSNWHMGNKTPEQRGCGCMLCMPYTSSCHGAGATTVPCAAYQNEQHALTATSCSTLTRVGENHKLGGHPACHQPWPGQPGTQEIVLAGAAAAVPEAAADGLTNAACDPP